MHPQPPALSDVAPVALALAAAAPLADAQSPTAVALALAAAHTLCLATELVSTASGSSLLDHWLVEDSSLSDSALVPVPYFPCACPTSCPSLRFLCCADPRPDSKPHEIFEKLTAVFVVMRHRPAAHPFAII